MSEQGVIFGEGVDSTAYVCVRCGSVFVPLQNTRVDMCHRCQMETKQERSFEYDARGPAKKSKRKN